MLNETDFIGMRNDVTSRSIIQNKSYRLTLFKGIEHLCKADKARYNLLTVNPAEERHGKCREKKKGKIRFLQGF